MKKGLRKLYIPIPIFFNHSWATKGSGLREKRSLVGSIILTGLTGGGRRLSIDLRHQGLTSFKTRDIQFKIMKLLEKEGYDLKQTKRKDYD